MKKILVLLFSLYVGGLYSQSVELAAGLNLNKFYQTSKSNPHYSGSYSMGSGYAIRGAYNTSEYNKWTLRFTIAYDQYQGGFLAENSGLGGGYSLDAKVKKSVLELGISPLNFKMFKHLYLSFGVNYSFLLTEDFTGIAHSWQAGDSKTWDVSDENAEFNSSTYFGVNGSISYDFVLSDDISIFPQYTYYLGLSKEFIKFPDFTKSMRHYFSIGVKKRIIPHSSRYEDSNDNR